MKTFSHLLFILFLFFLISFIACNEDDSDDSDSDDHNDLADDDDDTAGDDDDDCSDPVETPEGYFPNEASWLLATFDDPDLPITGLYGYFWVDWYKFTRCSYTGALSVAFLDADSTPQYQSNGGILSGLTIDYGQGYDIFVEPYIHTQLDPDDLTHYSMSLFGENYEIDLEIQVNHLKIWTGQWFSYYDATITDATIQFEEETYQTTGNATLERWYSVGGLDPTKADFVEGYWLYDSFTWTDEKGEEIHSLLHYWYTQEDGGEDFEVVPTYGVFSRGEDEYIVVSSDFDVDYPENENTEGYLRKYTMTGQLGNGQTFSYEATVDIEYKDQFPDEWLQYIRGYDRIESHSLISGELTFDEKTYTGTGLFEWKSSIFNPLVSE